MKTISVDTDIWYKALRTMLRPFFSWYNNGVLDEDATEFLAWDDVKVSLSQAKRLGNSDPTFEKLADDGAGSVGVYATAFSNSALQEVFFDAQLPHAYKAGTNIKFHIHWAPSGTGTGNVIWGIEYVALNDGVPIGSTTIVEATVAAPGVVLEKKSAVATLSGTLLVESSVIMCRLYRQTTGNTYAAKAFALSADFHIQKNKPGTYLEFPV